MVLRKPSAASFDISANPRPAADTADTMEPRKQQATQAKAWTTQHIGNWLRKAGRYLEHMGEAWRGYVAAGIHKDRPQCSCVEVRQLASWRGEDQEDPESWTIGMQLLAKLRQWLES
eukprot:g7616.t1